MIQKVTSQSFNHTPLGDFTSLTDVLTPGVDTVSLTVYWFNAYKSSSFPEVGCDKDYFFIWSTDHASAATGGCYWGKGNNLDLSDFTETGVIVIGNQSETPNLVRIMEAPDDEKIHLFFHTNASDPGNGGIQQTRLYTTKGGALDTANWTDRGRPLGVEPGETHTGYLRLYQKLDKTYIGTHTSVPNTAPNTPGEIRFSTSSDGRTFVRGNLFDREANAGVDRVLVPSFGTYFYLFDQRWLLCTTMAATGFGVGVQTFELVLFKVDDDYQTTEYMGVFNGGTQDYTWSIYVEGLTAHCYLNRRSFDLKYGTLDLSVLENL